MHAHHQRICGLACGFVMLATIRGFVGTTAGCGCMHVDRLWASGILDSGLMQSHAGGDTAGMVADNVDNEIVQVRIDTQNCACGQCFNVQYANSQAFHT